MGTVIPLYKMGFSRFGLRADVIILFALVLCNFITHLSAGCIVCTMFVQLFINKKRFLILLDALRIAHYNYLPSPTPISGFSLKNIYSFKLKFKLRNDIIYETICTFSHQLLQNFKPNPTVSFSSLSIDRFRETRPASKVSISSSSRRTHSRNEAPFRSRCRAL